ncbi:MAG: 5'-nucleotidase domain-containing protein, partial [Myxococcota bacterium]
HMMGELKEEIMADPEGFVELDASVPLALMDLRAAGKKVILITNSEWPYTKAMMSYAFDRYLEGTWRDLFDLVIVAARKPDFFSSSPPIFEVVDENAGHLAPVTGDLEAGKAYLGGSATLVERHLGVRGEDILYVGDHIFSDVNVSKKMHRWRTALVVRELEEDLRAQHGFAQKQATLTDLMKQKEAIEHEYSVARLAILRKDRGYGPQVEASVDALKAQIEGFRAELKTIDERIVPLVIEASKLSNERWGLLMRAGNDKSHLARQAEKNADAYMTRVACLGAETPFVYLRSPRGSLPHDPVAP